MKRWLIYHQYAFVVAIRRLALQPFSSLSNLFVMSLSLAIPLLAASVLISMQPVARQLPVNAELTLFLNQEATIEQANSLANQLKTSYENDIEAVTVLPKEQAAKQLGQTPAWADALNALPNNPLPHAIVVRLISSENQAKRAQELGNQWQDLEFTDSVQLDSEWVQRLSALMGFLRTGLGFLAIGVALVVLATVFNTVRLQSVTLREEIAVARMVGATESFVRRPFLYSGAISGLFACVFAVLITMAALVPLNKAILELGKSYGQKMVIELPSYPVIAISAVVVLMLCAMAARWSVSRHTHL